jgi:hypothetical protein
LGSLTMALTLHSIVQVDVVNRGYSGYNTRWATYLLPKIFPLVYL